MPRIYIIWLTLSVGVHAALFASWSTAPSLAAATGRIELELESSRPETASVQKISLPHRTARKERPLQNNHHLTPIPTVASGRDAVNDGTPSPAAIQTETLTIPAATISARNDRDFTTRNTPELPAIRSDPFMVQNEVWLRFEKAKTYPLIARRYGWEGHLLLGYQVDETGFIHNVRVTHSSGNAVLDQSAVRTLNTVGRLPTSLWRGGPVLDLQLPVIYKLTES
ncbi:MAG: TonB family protein [Gammaproteobacteria bacterium]|nr:TonB family protein [Gammaproteobacteria bacterium]